MPDAAPVFTTLNGQRVRWIGNFPPTDRRLYREKPGMSTHLVADPFPCGRLGVADLRARGLRGAYEPAPQSASA